MTDAERHAAAMNDPDAKPPTPEDFKRMKRTPQVKAIRRALDLSQEEFAECFQIPLGTLRDWEQGRKTRRRRPRLPCRDRAESRRLSEALHEATTDGST